MSLTEPVALWNIIVEVLKFLLPLLIAFGAVGVAVQSVRETRRGINAQILLQYKEEYGSNEIHEGMKLITRFLEDEEIKDTFLENFPKMRRQPEGDFTLYYAVDADGKVGSGSKTVSAEQRRDIDNTRRRISHRFTTLKILEKTGSLNRDFLY